MSFYETRELHKKEALRTHWYACSYNEAKEVIISMANVFGFSIVDINDTYQEILLDGRGSLVVKVCSFGKYEQGIDFNFDNHHIIDFGAGARFITKLYSYIGSKLRFKGVSLHP